MDNFEIPREQQKVKEVRKLSDGTIQIPYSKETTMWTVEFDLRIKKEKDGSVRIENKTPITEKNKGYIRSKEKYYLNTSDSKAFAQSLWKALDNYIGRERPSLSQEKWEKAYQLLGFSKKLIIEKSKKEQETLMKEIWAVQKDKDLERDAKSKTLKFEYHIGYWANEKVIYASLHETKKGEVSFKMEAWFLFTLAKLTSIETTFKKTELKTWLPNFIEQTFRKGIIYKKLLWSNENYIAKDETRNNAIKKAKKAAATFEMLTK